jgi:hypothetical protein
MSEHVYRLCPALKGILQSAVAMLHLGDNTPVRNRQMARALESSFGAVVITMPGACRPLTGPGVAELRKMLTQASTQQLLQSALGQDRLRVRWEERVNIAERLLLCLLGKLLMEFTHFLETLSLVGEVAMGNPGATPGKPFIWIYLTHDNTPLSCVRLCLMPS